MNNKKYILSIDAEQQAQGLFFDKKGQQVGIAQHEFSQIFSKVMG